MTWGWVIAGDLAVIDKKLKFKPSDIRFHSEDPSDHSRGPDSRVDKTDLIEAVSKILQSE